MRPGPQVVAVLGTDHHRFDRLVDWVDRWLERRASGGPGAAGALVTALVQHGSSTPPRLARGLELVPHDELLGYVAGASVVVCHGGPATMLEVRRHGRKPIVVPRDPELGAHVDSHQQLFCRRMAELGLVTLCESEPAFQAAMDAGMADPEAFGVTAEEAAAQRLGLAAAVAAAGAIIDDLAERHARRAG